MLNPNISCCKIGIIILIISINGTIIIIFINVVVVEPIVNSGICIIIQNTTWIIYINYKIICSGIFIATVREVAESWSFNIIINDYSSVSNIRPTGITNIIKRIDPPIYLVSFMIFTNINLSYIIYT